MVGFKRQLGKVLQSCDLAEGFSHHNYHTRSSYVTVWHTQLSVLINNFVPPRAVILCTVSSISLLLVPPFPHLLPLKTLLKTPLSGKEIKAKPTSSVFFLTQYAANSYI